MQAISGFLRDKDSQSLRQYLVVDPSLLGDAYKELRNELPTVDIEGAVELIDNDDSWPGFQTFMKLYFEFLRDVDFDNLLETHVQLSGLVR